MMSSNSSPSGSIPAGQGRKCEQFIGNGQKHTFDLCEVPSSIHAMTARVSRPLHPIALVIGNLRLDTFAAGYDVLVDRLGKRIYLEHALPKGELLFVEYPFDGPNQSPAVPAAPNPRAEPRNIPGWEPWDYQNWRDFAAAMRAGPTTWRFEMASGQHGTAMRGSIARASTVSSPGGDSKRQAWLQRR